MNVWYSRKRRVYAVLISFSRVYSFSLSMEASDLWWWCGGRGTTSPVTSIYQIEGYLRDDHVHWDRGFKLSITTRLLNLYSLV